MANPTGDQLAVIAIAKMTDDAIAGDLSPLGSAALSMSKAAMSIAADGKITEAELASVGVELASELMSQAQPIIQNLIAGLIQEATSQGLQGVAEAIPFVGQAVELIAGVANLFQSVAAAKEEQHQRDCAAMFVPIPTAPWGTGSGGSVVPADLFHGVSHWDGNPSFVRLLQALERYGSPKEVKKVQNAIPSYLQGSSPFKGITGVPKAVREQLKEMRHAMAAAQGNSWDGGRTIFPLYMDLLYAQWRLKRINGSFLVAMADWGGCSDVDALVKNARESLAGLLHSWKMTVEPTYGVDKLALTNMLAKVGKKTPIPLHFTPEQQARIQGMIAEAKAKKQMMAAIASSPIVRLPLAKKPSINLAPLARLSAAHKALAPGIRRPSRAELAMMSPAERQRIIEAIIAAAHGAAASPAREQHIDQDLNANEPAPESYVAEDVDGGDEFGFYSEDAYDYECYGDTDLEGYDCQSGEHIDDEEDLDPWGYTFPEFATGARIHAVQQRGIENPGVRKGFDPQPDPPGFQAYGAQTYVGAARPIPRIQVRPKIVLPNVPKSVPYPLPPPPPPPKLNLAKALATFTHPKPPPPPTPKLTPKAAAAIARGPLSIKQSKPTLHDLQLVKAAKMPKGPKTPMPKPVAPSASPYPQPDEDFYENQPDYDYDGYEEADIDAYADGEASTLDYEDEEPSEYDGGYGEYSGDAASDWGYGYGDYGHEEDYPHDGSTYGWEDCW